MILHNGKLILALLVAVFVLPIALSWYLVFYTDFARNTGGVQYGDLITPPRQLQNISLIPVGEDEMAHTLYGKWSLLFFVNGLCDARCEENLYRVRQIRLAVGRRLSRVQRVMIFKQSDNVKAPTDWLAKQFPGQLYGISEAAFLTQFEDLKVPGALFLVDPRGFLMMRYAKEADPSGIIRNLSRLLRISHQSSDKIDLQKNLRDHEPL